VANATPTFRSAAERIILQARRDGLRTANARLARLEKHVFPALGAVQVGAVAPSDISAVLAAAARGGLAAESLRQLGVDIRTVFNELVRDDLLEKNPARVEKIRMPKARRDTRKRVLLTDPEFLVLIAAPSTPRQLTAMAVCSRCFGGLRPSDIYAWQWSDIDLEGGTAAAPRPKTEHHGAGGRERIVLPAIVADTLRTWGPRAGGAVFPRPFPMLARALRVALLAAGVTRHELHHDTAQTRRVDFYSLRRGFVTAVAASGASATVGMRLAGHTNMATHQRYHLPAALTIPAAAVPAADPFEAALAAFVA
jgi:integrase